MSSKRGISESKMIRCLWYEDSGTHRVSPGGGGGIY